MIDLKNCSEEELWVYVATHLKKRDIDTVLVGGAVVSIYTDGAFESGDLDLILTNFFVKNVPVVMKEIGFKRKGRHYIHPDCKHLYIEFPQGPLEIGNDSSIVPDEKTVEGIKIKILSPTDCVKDRIASFIHFKDRVGFEQAVLVAQKHAVNLKKIEDWCQKEDSRAVFEEFKERLKKKS